MNKHVFHRYCLILVRLSVFSTVFLVLSSCGGGSGEFYMSPCFPLPDSWCATVPPDTAPPTTPTNLVALSASPSGINLAWDKSNDIDSTGYKDVSGYKVYKDGIFFANAYGATNSATVSYSAGRLAPTTQYCFTVSAYDGAGNESGKSNSACATTQPDTAQPAAPTVLSAQSDSSSSIYLYWNESTDDGYVVEYRIYRDGMFIGSSIYSAFTDTGLTGETQYCYSVQAVDAAAKNSAPSNEACATTSWKMSEAGYDPPTWTSIALDSNENAHIAYFYSYYDYAIGKLTGAVNYATNLSGTWQSLLIGETHTSSFEDYVEPSIALLVNTDGARHVAYYDPSQRLLQHWTRSASLWMTESIAMDTFNIKTVAMAHDGSGKLHVVVNPWGVVTYLTNASGNWTSSVVGDNSSFNYGKALTCAIAADGAGKVYIGYYDLSSQSLKFVSNASGTWETEAVDNTADVGIHTSIAVDAGGKSHISYYDRTNGDLKYATNASGSWSVQSIDSVGDVGPYAAIALDGDGNAHISYTDATRNFLRYATNKSGSWATYIISSAVTETCNSSLGYTSLAVDSLGKAHISYLGNRPDYTSLCYATNR